MDSDTSIVLAFIAVISLMAQGMVKAMSMLATRKAAKSDPAPPKFNADQSGSFGRVLLTSDIPADFANRFQKLESKIDDLHKGIVEHPVTGQRSEWLDTLKLIEKHMGDQVKILNAMNKK